MKAIKKQTTGANLKSGDFVLISNDLVMVQRNDYNGVKVLFKQLYSNANVDCMSRVVTLCCIGSKEFTVIEFEEIDLFTARALLKSGKLEF